MSRELRACVVAPILVGCLGGAVAGAAQWYHENAFFIPSISYNARSYLQPRDLLWILGAACVLPLCLVDLLWFRNRVTLPSGSRAVALVAIARAAIVGLPLAAALVGRDVGRHALGADLLSLHLYALRLALGIVLGLAIPMLAWELRRERAVGGLADRASLALGASVTVYFAMVWAGELHVGPYLD